MGSISKRRREHFEVTNEDRISNLPTSLIGHILSFLPTKKAVATSVLSTKWKYLWTSITTLDFDDGLVHVSTTPRKGSKKRQSLVEMSFVNFVYRVLTRNVSALQKFRLNCTRIYDVSHVNVWVSTALSRNPRELHLSNIGCLPRELYACRSLVVLKLCGTTHRLLDLSIPTLICLQSLKVLVIESLLFLDDDSIYRLFSSCHVLEDLSIELCDWRNISVFNISAPNLKSLTIKCRTWTNVSGKYKIVLNTPNLQDIKYEDYVAAGYSGNKLNAIVKADISFVKTFPVRDAYKENLAIAEFVERISKVQWLHLSNYSIECCRYRFINFDCLTYLELGGNHQYIGWKLLVDFMFMSSRLEILIFWGLPQDEREEIVITSPEYAPCCLLYYLKKIEIKLFEGKSGELKMAEYFMMYSSCLEKLMIHPACHVESLEICKKVLMLPRGSKTCRVEVLEPL